MLLSALYYAACKLYVPLGDRQCDLFANADTRNDHHPVNTQVPLALKAMVPLHSHFFNTIQLNRVVFFIMTGFLSNAVSGNFTQFVPSLMGLHIDSVIYL